MLRGPLSTILFLLAALLLAAPAQADDCIGDVSAACTTVAEQSSGSSDTGCEQPGSHEGRTTLSASLFGGLVLVEHQATSYCETNEERRYESARHETNVEAGSLIQADHESSGYQNERNGFTDSGCGGRTRAGTHEDAETVPPTGRSMAGPCLGSPTWNGLVGWGDLVPQ